MDRGLIWDLPTRVLHWGIAGSISGALALGLAVDDEHPLFAYHMLLGLAAGGLIVLRLVWGIIGSYHARFGNWTWSPIELARYAVGALTGRARLYAGHNPGTTWAAAAMFVLVVGLILTGLNGNDAAEDLHEAMATVLLVVVGAHLAGLALHWIRHRENLARSMIDGRKEAPPQAAISSSHAFAAVLISAVGCIFVIALFRGYDADTGRVRLPGLRSTIALPLESHDAHEHSAPSSRKSESAHANDRHRESRPHDDD